MWSIEIKMLLCILTIFAFYFLSLFFADFQSLVRFRFTLCQSQINSSFWFSGHNPHSNFLSLSLSLSLYFYFSLFLFLSYSLRLFESFISIYYSHSTLVYLSDKPNITFFLLSLSIKLLYLQYYSAIPFFSSHQTFPFIPFPHMCVYLSTYPHVVLLLLLSFFLMEMR